MQHAFKDLFKPVRIGQHNVSNLIGLADGSTVIPTEHIDEFVGSLFHFILPNRLLFQFFLDAGSVIPDLIRHP